MSVKIKVEHDYSRTDAFQVDPADIIVDQEENGRAEVGDVSDMVASLQSHGQIEPVIARRVKGNELQLVLGYRRHAAFMEINKTAKTPMRMMVIVRSMSDDEAFENNVIENCHRKDTSPIDDARNIVRFLEHFGRSEAEVAAIFRRPVAWIRVTASLANLSKKIQAQIHKGEMGKSAALQLVTSALDDKERTALMAEIKSELPRDTPIEEADSKKAKRARAKSVGAAVEKKLREQGEIKRSRSVRQIRLFLESQDGDATSAAGRRFLKRWLQFVNGEIDEKAMTTTLDNAFKM